VRRPLSAALVVVTASAILYLAPADRVSSQGVEVGAARNAIGTLLIPMMRAAGYAGS